MPLFQTGRVLTALRQTSFVQKINSFLSRPAYILPMALLTAVCNIAGWEWVIYPLFVAVMVYTCLLGEDLLPLMPLFLFCYLAPSRDNNPGAYQDSFFSQSGALLPVLAGALLLAVLYRVFTDPQRGGKAFFTRKRKLTPGLLILWLVFALSGIGTEGFGLKSIAFGLLQGAAFSVPYFLFTGMVDWEKTRKDYFAWIGFAAGCLLLAELGWIYTDKQVITSQYLSPEAGGSGETVFLIHRNWIFTGWGMHNNIGGMLAMMIPFAFYLASRYNRGWIGSVLGTLFLIGVIFTCSRGSALFGFAGWLVCIVLLLLSAKNSKANLIALIGVVSLTVLTVTLFHRQLFDLFYQVISLGTDPSSRDWLYKNALELFRQHPLFGISFYPPAELSWSWSNNADFSSFFPARWHNTLFQLLATGGISAFGAYLCHRLQTLRVFFRDKTREKAFIGCSVLILLGCSLLDCHLFNIGPTLFYSMALAFAECCVKPHSPKTL